MKLGIVGLPNVGKSTLFNAITNAGVPADNYAFCTIDPNVGVVNVPDERLNWLADFHKPKKFTPAVIEFVDIAGLVKGASKGEGLGNKFLSNIRTTDAIVHVVRCFEDSNVTHVEGDTDPLRDIEIINLGLVDTAFHHFHVSHDQLQIDDLDVTQGIGGAFHVGDVGVLEAADNVNDGVGGADVGQELVAQT